MILAFACMSTVMGVDSFNTDFTTESGGKFWTKDNSYKTFPKFSYDPAGKMFHVEKVISKNGFGFTNQKQKIDARKDDVLLVKFEVMGNGTFFVAPEYFSGNKWIGVGKNVLFPLTANWTKGEIKIKIIDLKNVPTTAVMMGFGGNAGTELFIKNISVLRKKVGTGN